MIGTAEDLAPLRVESARQIAMIEITTSSSINVNPRGWSFMMEFAGR
jgi:hypothetical protein